MRQRYNVSTNAYPHTCTYTFLYCELLLLFQLSAATPPPASTQHPEITAFPSGRQAVEGTAMDMFCLLSNERRNVTAGLSAGPSQPSIHTCGISTVYQTAGRQLASLFLSFSILSFSSSLNLTSYLSISLTLSASLQLRACPRLFLSTNKQRPRSALPVCLTHHH